ncbi:TOBE domain-containing protein, partial [Escherichia coli]|nr:TOBE domain-containing protein [Escherichia coli]
QPLKPGAAVTLGIRPEHLTPEVTTGTVVEFQCEVVERLGNNTYLFGQCYGHDNVKVLLPGDVHFRPWQKINLAFDERFCMVFDENDLRISADITAPDAH